MSALVPLVVALLVAGAPPSSSKPRPSDLRCGAYCLYIGLKAIDVPVASFEALERMLGPPTAAGYSLGQLAEAAQRYGATTLGVQTDLDRLRRRPGRFACIARVDGTHFVNLVEIDDREVHLVDFPVSRTIPAASFRVTWSGEALLLARSPLLPEEDLPRPWPWQAIGIGLLACLGMVTTGWAWRRFHQRPKT